MEPTLWDTAPAVKARDAAIAAVGEAADDVWRIAAFNAIADCASRLELFTTDDVWHVLAAGQASTHERRALGALMKHAASQGVIEATSLWRQSARPECHARPVRVWRTRVAGVA